MRNLVSCVLVIFGLTSAAYAQSVSEEFEKSLNDQGFVIESTGYTWLWRIVVRASNGIHEREIVISRGSEQILQDNWRRLEPSEADTPQNRSNSEERPPNPRTKPSSAGNRPSASERDRRSPDRAARPAGNGGQGGGGGGGKGGSGQ